MRRRRPLRAAIPAALLAGALALALALAGCGGGGSDNDGSPLPGDAGAVTTSLPLSVSGAVDLRRLVLTEAPAGYDLLASPPFGAVDLDRLLTDFSDAPAEDRSILETARFKRGYTRGWLRESPRSFLGVFVFEFQNEDGARSARDKFAAQTASKKNATRVAVEGITDAVGESYIHEKEGDPPERVHVVSFVRGPRLYQVSGESADVEAAATETVAFAVAEAEIAA